MTSQIKVLNVKEAAAVLKLHPNTVYGLVHAGEIAAKRSGRRILIREEAIVAFLRSGEA